jgi:hypothetical protein
MLRQHLLAQLPGVTVGCMRDPRPDPRMNLGPGQSACQEIALHLSEPAPTPNDICPHQAHAIRKDPPAKKGNSILCTVYPGLAGMKLYPQPAEPFRDTVTHFAQRLLVVTKEQEVIDIPHEFTRLQLPAHKVIEWVQVDIGKELRCLVAKRKPPASLVRGKQIITGEVGNHLLLGIGTLDDPGCKLNGRPALDNPAKKRHENLMVD